MRVRFFLPANSGSLTLIDTLSSSFGCTRWLSNPRDLTACLDPLISFNCTFFGHDDFPVFLNVQLTLWSAPAAPMICPGCSMAVASKSSSSEKNGERVNTLLKTHLKQRSFKAQPQGFFGGAGCYCVSATT